MRGFLKEHETSFAAVAIPKLFFFDAGYLTAVVVAEKIIKRCRGCR